MKISIIHNPTITASFCWIKTFSEDEQNKFHKTEFDPAKVVIIPTKNKVFLNIMILNFSP